MAAATSSEARPRLEAADVGLLAALAFLWGIAYLFIRQGIEAGASPLIYASARYLMAAAAFAAIAALAREAAPERRAALLSAGIGGVFVIGLYGGFLYWGEQYTTGGYASVLSTSAPILTVALAYLMLPAERLRASTLVGIAIGAAGVVVIVLPDLFGGTVGTWPGPAFVLGAFVSAAIGTVSLRRLKAGRQGFWQLGLQFAVGGVLLGALSLVLPYPHALPLSGAVLGPLTALVVLSSLLGYFAYYRLHHRVGPVLANSVAYLLPVVGVGIGSGLLGEAATLPELVGTGIVLVGVTLILRGSSTAAH